MIGRRAVFCAWMTVSSSISLAQEISLSLMLVGISPPLCWSVLLRSWLRVVGGTRTLITDVAYRHPRRWTTTTGCGVAMLRWTPGRDSHPRLVVCSHAPELLGHRALISSCAAREGLEPPPSG